MARIALPAPVRYGLGVALLAALYDGVAQLSYTLGFAGAVGAIVWLPVGVGVAFLTLGGVRFWPGILLGDLLANNYSALPLGVGVGQTCGNLAEIVVVAIMIRRLDRGGPALATIAGLGRMVTALAFGVAISATVGSVSLRVAGVVSHGSSLEVWRTWWLGDFAGGLLVVPLALAWARPPPREWWRARGLEGALLLVAVAGLSEVALHSSQPLTYVVFPGLIWAALRFGPHGATLAVAVAGGFTLWGTVNSVGPFHAASVGVTVVSTQLYIAVSALSSLFLAVAVTERERIGERLATSRRRLVEAADQERSRLHRNLHDGAQQRLAALAVRLRLAAEKSQEAPASAPQLFAEAEAELLLAIDELRELARGINPPVLVAQGLAEAIRGVAARSAVPVVLVELPDRRLDDAVEAAAYYVIAEAVTNAQRYAQASSVRVNARVARRWLRIEIADDGLGGAVEVAGSGLEGLRDRVASLGGRLELESPPGGGTRIVATLPVARA